MINFLLFFRHVLSTLVMTAVLLSAASALAQEADNSCLQCHESQPGRLGEPVTQWRTSIHAGNGIACHSCHGGDPALISMEAMDPGRGFLGVPVETDIPDFCGRCHVGVREDYLESAHGRALGKGGPQCVTCHGNHRVMKASPALINPQDCSRCHEYGRAGEIKGAVEETDRLIGVLEGDLTALHRAGIATREMEGELFSLRNSFHRLFHSVEVEKVRAETARVRSDLEKIRVQVEQIQQTLFVRKVGGGIVVGLLVLAGLLAAFIRRTYHEEET